MGTLVRTPCQNKKSREPSSQDFWLGRLDSNQRMPESKSGALPLGDAPI